LLQRQGFVEVCMFWERSSVLVRFLPSIFPAKKVGMWPMFGIA
jgi:hypothetical protein